MPAQHGTAGALLVMIAAVLWGTTGTAAALSAYPGSPLGLGTARVALAGLLLLAAAVLRHRRDVARLLWRPGIRATVLVGAACIAGYQACFFVATRQTGVAVGTLTAIGSAPVFAGLLGAVLGARASRQWMAATAVALAGLGLLVTPTGDVQVRPLGVAAGLAAGAAYAGYTWCSRRL
ncbi:EamA family transporter, partial [Micromonospora sp. NPDC049679]|uniref:EamA family transporter n=1 Tax=Micromonospora sp. NPDC049679 TaxID=3155920 RepID=UPI0033D623EF